MRLKLTFLTLVAILGLMVVACAPKPEDTATPENNAAPQSNVAPE